MNPTLDDPVQACSSDPSPKGKPGARKPVARAWGSDCCARSLTVASRWGHCTLPYGRVSVGVLRWYAVASFLLGAALSGPLRADQVNVEGAQHTGAKIVGYQGGRLQFRAADGTLHTAWISDVELLVVERGGAFVDFNQAERYLARGEADKAVVRYRRTLRLTEDFWADLVESRLLLACDRAQDIGRATLNFIRVVRGQWSGPAAAVRLMPQAIPIRRDAAVVRAVEQLDSAIGVAPNDEQRAPLELFRYEILRRAGDQRSAEAEQAIAVMVIPELLGCERVYTIQLVALKGALSDDVRPEELESLDRAIRDCPKATLPGFLLLKGETLLRTATTREEIIRAAWPFMRVAIHMPSDPRAAEGLVGAAAAVERMGRRDKAIALLEECLQRKRGLTKETRQKAEAALSRLRSGGEGTE